MANPLITNYDTRKLFVFNNRFRTATYTNGTGDTVTIPKGRLMGRIYLTNKIEPMLSTATNGSQQPLGVTAKEYVVTAGSSVVITYCFAGDVDQDLIVLGGSDTLTTVVDEYTTSPTTDYDRAGTIYDLITRNTFIVLVDGEELTAIDNPQS